MEIRQSSDFTSWMAKLRDRRAFHHVQARISHMRDGNFSDTKSVGEGVMESRIHYGPGYRLYYTRKGDAVVFLLVGGNKSTQKKDIERAKALARAINKEG